MFYDARLTYVLRTVNVRYTFCCVLAQRSVLNMLLTTGCSTWFIEIEMLFTREIDILASRAFEGRFCNSSDTTKFKYKTKLIQVPYVYVDTIM